MHPAALHPSPARRQSPMAGPAPVDKAPRHSVSPSPPVPNGGIQPRVPALPIRGYSAERCPDVPPIGAVSSGQLRASAPTPAFASSVLVEGTQAEQGRYVWVDASIAIWEPLDWSGIPARMSGDLIDLTGTSDEDEVCMGVLCVCYRV